MYTITKIGTIKNKHLKPYLRYKTNFNLWLYDVNSIYCLLYQ